MVVYWSVEGNGWFTTMEQLYLEFRWTQKDTIIISQKSWAEIKRQAFTMVSVPYMHLNQTLYMFKSAIYNKRNNVRNIIFNVQSLQTVMAVGIGEINPQGRIWMVATWVTDILFVLEFISNFFKGYLCWRHVNTTLADNKKHHIKCWYYLTKSYFMLYY